MFTNIKKWFKEYEIKEKTHQRRAGYDYAAGKLLRDGEAAVDGLYEDAANPFDRNLFDVGIVDALNEFRFQQITADDKLELLKESSLGILTPFEI